MNHTAICIDCKFTLGRNGSMKNATKKATKKAAKKAPAKKKK